MKNSLFHTDGISLSVNLVDDLQVLLSDYPDDKVFILLDDNTVNLCWPLLKSFRSIPEHHILILPTGEDNKSLAQVEKVWNFLGEQRADRKSILVNIGGGLLTDLGGFAASTFKRGIGFLNIPTTLLAMVDASVGGKTGINFRGFKNEIGVIRDPLHVFLYLPFLRSLDSENFKSGFAELLKAALIRDKELWNELMKYSLLEKSEEELSHLLWKGVMIKKVIVDEDPNELGNRKALNFGHTIGHAVESYLLKVKKPLLHGYAVAYGMMVEMLMSKELKNMPEEQVSEVCNYLESVYGKAPSLEAIKEEVLEWMRFDKKNERNRINFTLLNQIGSFSINNFVTEDKILAYLSE